MVPPSSNGTVVIAGLVYQIIKLELENSRIVITARRYGKAPALTNEPITIFGQDGRGIGQGGHVSVGRVGWAGGHADVKVGILFEGLTDGAAPVVE